MGRSTARAPPPSSPSSSSWSTTTPMAASGALTLLTARPTTTSLPPVSRTLSAPFPTRFLRASRSLAPPAPFCLRGQPHWPPQGRQVLLQLLRVLPHCPRPRWRRHGLHRRVRQPPRPDRSPVPLRGRRFQARRWRLPHVLRHHWRLLLLRGRDQLQRQPRQPLRAC